VPLDAPESQFIAALVVSLLLGALVPFLAPKGQSTSALALWLAKIVVTLLLMQVFESRYDVLDAYDYHYATYRFGDILGSWSFGEGTRLIEGMAQLVAAATGGSYYAEKVVFSFVGLWGILLLSRAAQIVTSEELPLAPLAIGLIPSILFWTSILGKDPVVFLGLSLLVLSLVQVREGGVRPAVFFIVALVILGSVRVWLLPIAALTAVVATLRERQSPWVRAFTIAATVVGGIVAWRVVMERFFSGGQLALLSRVAELSQDWARGGAAQVIEQDLSTPLGFISFLPEGAVTALFRPFPLEATNAFALVASLEIVALVAVLLLLSVRVRWRDVLARSPVPWLASFIVMWSVLYAPISYQNLGSAVRFRLQIFPAGVLILATLWANRRRAQIEPIRERRAINFGESQ
jgi:hypothetical protein